MLSCRFYLIFLLILLPLALLAFSAVLQAYLLHRSPAGLGIYQFRRRLGDAGAIHQFLCPQSNALPRERGVIGGGQYAHVCVSFVLP